MACLNWMKRYGIAKSKWVLQADSTKLALKPKYETTIVPSCRERHLKATELACMKILGLRLASALLFFRCNKTDVNQSHWP
jgi:transposase-like protein